VLPRAISSGQLEYCEIAERQLAAESYRGVHSDTKRGRYDLSARYHCKATCNHLISERLIRPVLLGTTQLKA
jgi:hypothetical protein